MRRLRFRHSVRLAAILLLLVWIGPVTLEQTDTWRLLRWAGGPQSALAEPRVIPAGRALILEPGTLLKLHLRDGSMVEGRFLGRTLLDSALYASRFEAYADSSDGSPLVLGETLHVALYDGRQLTAAFAGYGELTLLLHGPGGSPHVRVPMWSAKGIRRANGDPVEPGRLAQLFRRGRLPSAEALALGDALSVGAAGEWWANALRVPAQDIELATADLPSTPGVTKGGASGGEVAGMVVLGVLVSVVLVYVILHTMMFKGASSGCRSSSAPPNWNPLGFARVRLTTRPFDLQRGRYVDEPLAAADPWPVSSDVATVLADPATSTMPGSD